MSTKATKKAPKQRRTGVIKLRVTESERQAIAQKAGGTGRVSAYLRELAK